MENKIICPHCKQEIDVEEILVHNIEDRYEAKFKIKEKELAGKYSKKELEIEKMELEIADKNEKINLLIEEKATALSIEKEGEIKRVARKEIELANL
jgi:uncharacterized Zn finger protein (UPF0148 family)